MKKILLICSIFVATAITANAQTSELNVQNNTSYNFEITPHGENSGCGFTYKAPSPSLLTGGPSNVYFPDVSSAGLVDGGGNPINMTGQFTYVQIRPEQFPGCSTLSSVTVGDCGTTNVNFSVYTNSSTCATTTVSVSVTGGNVDIN